MTSLPTQSSTLGVYEAPIAPTRERYEGFPRQVAAVIAGVVAGLLLSASAENGIGLATRAGRSTETWTILLWGDHWIWRALASSAATFAGGFIAGLIGRRHARRVGILVATPSVLYWAVVAVAGWLGHFPGSTAPMDVPLGYRIAATVLAFATIPLSISGASPGVAYGRANGAHYDSRRRALLGVRWYHFLWLPILIHIMVVTSTFGAAYGMTWFVASWRAMLSPLAIVPVMFYMAMFYTLVWLGTGALRTYEALAGFDDDSGQGVGQRVLKYGIGYTLGVIVAQTAISLVHFGLAKLFA